MDDDPDRFVVMPSRGRLLVLALLSLAFFAAAYALWSGSGPFARFPRWAVVGAALAMAAFAVPALLYAALRLLRPTPVVIVDRDGIEDRSTMMSAGRVAWDEVTGFEIRSVGRGQRFLTVHVRDPEAVIARSPRLLRRSLQKSRALMGSPVNIGGLAGRPEDVQAAIESYRDRRRSR